MRPLPIFITLAALSIFPWPLWAARAAPGDKLVRATLLADVSAVRPGQPFTVGVLFKIEPKWHVYWTNPGDSGAPTEVKFTAPDGFTVGDVQYPVPVKFNQPGDLVGYGYEDALLLTATVTPPAKLGAQSRVKIGAEARWLCCRDVCIPGRRSLELTLPVSSQSSPANESVFREWGARLPVEASAAPAVETIQWSPDPAAGAAMLAVNWRQQPGKDVQVYPGASDALEVQNVEATHGGSQTRVNVKARVLTGQKLEREALPALLVFTDPAGRRWGVRTAMPLAAWKAVPDR